MKILNVCNRFYPAIGGVETNVFNIASRFSADGHTVVVVCSDFIDSHSDNRFGKKDLQGSIKNITYRRLKGFKFFKVDATTIIPYLPIYLLLHIREYNVIHAQSYGYFVSWITILICKILGKKVIYTPNYADETTLPLLVKQIYDLLFAGWSFRAADKVITLTDLEREILIKKFKIKRKKIMTISPSIDMSEIINNNSKIKTKEILEGYGIDNGNRNIIEIARIAKNKGHIYLIKAFQKIENSNLLIVGKDWGEMKFLKQYIKDNNIKNIFFFTKLNDEKKNELLSISDVLVLPSIGGESFGIVLIEAMAHGVPVVAAPIGGIPELIVNGKNGYLFQKNDVNDLTQKIMKVLINKSSMEKYCTAFAKKYDWKEVYFKMKKVYEEIF